MRILFHSYAYETGWTYQENLLPEACIAAGNEVCCVASCIGVNKDGKRGYIDTSHDPHYLIRLKARYELFVPLSYRMRELIGFYDVLESFKPDVIFFHAMQSLNLQDAEHYKKKNPNTRVYLNSHTDYYTSGRNILSRIFFHRIFYRKLLHRYINMVDNIFYVGINCGMFLWNEYAIPKEKTELMPIGSSVISLEKKAKSRETIIEEFSLNNQSIIFIQAGKLNSDKKILDSIKTFSNTKDPDFIFLIAGSIEPDIREEAMGLISKDHRIIYLGWLSGDDLFRYLEAADFYVQPGKGSAIFENAMCSLCVVIAGWLVDYEPFVEGNGWLIRDMSELSEIYSYISDNKDAMPRMRQLAKEKAEELLEESELIKKIK